MWFAYRKTEKQKAGKARNIKEKQLKNSRNTVSKLHVVYLSSPRDNFLSQDNSIRITTPQDFGSGEFFCVQNFILGNCSQVVNREPILRGVLNRHEPFISYIQIILHQPNSYKMHGDKECILYE